MTIEKNKRIAELLHIGRMYGENPHPGNYLKGLLDMIIQKVDSEMVVCEVGSFRGISSELFCLHVKTLFCIDYWTPYSWEYNENNIFDAETEFDIMRQNYSNIIKMKSKSVDASKCFPSGFFDMVYIDADHAEQSFREDMEAWIPKVKVGGIISGHDYGFVGDYVTDFSGGRKPDVFEDGSWCFVKER